MKNTVTRVEVVEGRKPNEELRKAGALQFTEVPLGKSRAQVTAQGIPLEVDTVGVVRGYVLPKEKTTKVGEEMANLLEKFPPAEEPVEFGYDNDQTNLKLTAIVGTEGSGGITRVIASEKDLEINLRP